MHIAVSAGGLRGSRGVMRLPGLGLGVQLYVQPVGKQARTWTIAAASRKLIESSTLSLRKDRRSAVRRPYCFQERTREGRNATDLIAAYSTAFSGCDSTGRSKAEWLRATKCHANRDDAAWRANCHVERTRPHTSSQSHDGVGGGCPRSSLGAHTY